MRRWILLAAVLAILPLASRAAEQIIYPRAAAAPNSVPDKPVTGVSPMLLVSALIAAGAGGWMVWRQRRAPKGFGMGQGRKLSVTESKSLGNRQYLAVAEYDGQKFLLGICPGRIEMLSPLGDGPKKAP